MDGLFIVAVHSLVYLGHMGCYVSSADLARNVCTNPARVRKVMSILVEGGLVEARKGSAGGYRLKCDAHDLSLRDIAAALGSSFARPAWKGDDFDMECLISTHMRDVLDELGGEMDRLLYGYLAGVSVKDIEDSILTKDWSDAKRTENDGIEDEESRVLQ